MRHNARKVDSLDSLLDSLLEAIQGWWSISGGVRMENQVPRVYSPLVVLCFSCRKPGHRATECRQRKVQSGGQAATTTKGAFKGCHLFLQGDWTQVSPVSVKSNPRSSLVVEPKWGAANIGSVRGRKEGNQHH